jgi:hypothetical protein
MKCRDCGYENRADVQFCEECGQPLPKPAAAVEVTCPACGSVNRSGVMFCEECGASLAAQPAPVAAPRTPTQPFTWPIWLQVTVRFVVSGISGYVTGKLGMLVLNFLLSQVTVTLR